MQSSSNFLKSYFRKLPLSLLIIFACFIGALLLFVFVAHEVLWEQEEAADQYIFDFLSRHVIQSSLTGPMETITHFASSTFLQVAYGVLVALYLMFRDFKRAMEIIAIGLGGFLVNYVMKLSFQRVRPPNPLIAPLHNFSFPSGHATSAFIFYGLLAYLLWKTNLPKTLKITCGIVLILFSLVIGFSRIYLRLHYPSDVLAGFCIGFAWLLLTIYIFEHLKQRADKEMGGTGA